MLAIVEFNILALLKYIDSKNEFFELIITYVFLIIVSVDRGLKYQQLWMPMIPLFFEITNAPRSITCWLYSALFPKAETPRVLSDKL